MNINKKIKEKLIFTCKIDDDNEIVKCTEDPKNQRTLAYMQGDCFYFSRFWDRYVYAI